LFNYVFALCYFVNNHNKQQNSTRHNSNRTLLQIKSNLIQQLLSDIITWV